MISLCSGVWPKLCFVAEGRQGHAEPGPCDILLSACGLQLYPRAQLVVVAAIIFIMGRV